MVNVCVASLRGAVLSAPVVFAFTEYETIALPVPLPPAVIDANGELLTAGTGRRGGPVSRAVVGRPRGARVALTLSVPPAVATVTDEGAIENWQAPVTVSR